MNLAYSPLVSSRNQPVPMPLRPLVAVTSSLADTPQGRRVRVNEAYVRAMELAGLVPVLVPPLERPEDAERIAEVVGGVMLTGGQDVDPGQYGQRAHPSSESPDVLRDATEIALVRAAKARGLPLLGICRGCQVMNVALGGTLIQDLPTGTTTGAGGAALDHRANAHRTSRVHEIVAEPGSRLVDAVRAERFATNSMHHQAPDRIGDGLRVVARATDGIAEALESEGNWWAVGVQWHPEELTGTREDYDRSLFAAFAEAVRAYRGRG